MLSGRLHSLPGGRREPRRQAHLVSPEKVGDGMEAARLGNSFGRKPGTEQGLRAGEAHLLQGPEDQGGCRIRKIWEPGESKFFSQ